MSLKNFVWRVWLVGALWGALFAVVCFMTVSVYPAFSWSAQICWGVFVFDVASVFLLFISVFLGVALMFWKDSMSSLSVFMIGVSLVSSSLCYCCSHALWFWVFYEGSIAPLLILLAVESPYSERYFATWYFLGYTVVTSLPMVVCFYKLCSDGGSFNVCEWNVEVYNGSGGWVALFLAVLFITKIPMPPFHTWLPIVHAEANSPVSICLSGYVMKLGILGVYRYCFPLIPSAVFCYQYIIVCLLACVVFFFAASRELDGKRWIAFLSLAHIIMASVCFCVGEVDLGGKAFVYCLGHGLSAAFMFALLWLGYESTGTRNLCFLKDGYPSGLSSLLVVLCLCTVCSLPPTLQFFCEVYVVMEAGGFSNILLLGLFVFIFLSGLVPMYVLGGFLSRVLGSPCRSIGLSDKGFSLVFFALWCFVLFMVS